MPFRSFSTEELRKCIVTAGRAEVGSHHWMSAAQSSLYPTRHASFAPPWPYDPTMPDIQREIAADLKKYARYPDQSRVKYASVFGDLKSVYLQRDFIMAFLHNNPGALQRWSTGNDVWCNCLEFLYLVFFRAKILNESDLQKIAHQSIELHRALVSRCLEHTKETPFPGDIVLFTWQSSQPEYHIGIIANSAHDECSVISLEKIDPKMGDFPPILTVYEGRLWDMVRLPEFLGLYYRAQQHKKEFPTPPPYRTPHFISPEIFLEILMNLANDSTLSLEKNVADAPPTPR